MNDGLQPGESLRVSFYDNKYAVIQLKSGEMRYLRYGEPWKAADSDNADRLVGFGRGCGEGPEWRARSHQRPGGAVQRWPA